MKRIVLLLGLTVTNLPVVAQNGVYKCTDPAGAVIYQGAPCGNRQGQVTLVEPRKREPESMNADAGTLPQTASTGSALTGSELIPGMSDTKVLNMRGWGRPQHIARSRGEDGWREEWTYVSRADGATRLVQFVNGKVAAVRSEAQQIARIEPQRSERRMEPLQIAQTPALPQTQAQSDPTTARAEEAARVVERMVRGGPPAAQRWQQDAAATGAFETATLRPRAEEDAVANETDATQVEPSPADLQPAPRPNAIQPAPVVIPPPPNVAVVQPAARGPLIHATPIDSRQSTEPAYGMEAQPQPTSVTSQVVIREQQAVAY